MSVSVDIQFLSFPLVSSQHPASFSHLSSTVSNNCIKTSLIAKYNIIMVFKSVYTNNLDKLGLYFSLKTGFISINVLTGHTSGLMGSFSVCERRVPSSVDH